MNDIKLFDDDKIRVEWNNEREDWYFSIVDVVAVLTSNDFQGARNYWKVLKHRLKEEGNETVTNCNQLKMKAQDGKLRETDVADTQQLLRLIQSIPSKKAEPFKEWLAMVGNDRINETADPELAIDRAMHIYLQKGYSKDWINQRLKTIEVRKELTDEWNRVGIEKHSDYAILTNEMTKAWAGKTVREYKIFKNLKKENLRDNMTNLELVLNMLAEVSTKELSKENNPNNFEDSINVAKRGGFVAKAAKEKLGEQLKEDIISSKNTDEIHFKNKNNLE